MQKHVYVYIYIHTYILAYMYIFKGICLSLCVGLMYNINMRTCLHVLSLSRSLSLYEIASGGRDQDADAYFC